MNWLLDVDQSKVEGYITQLEEVCNNISIKRTDMTTIEDGFSEGNFYQEYIRTVEELGIAMEKVEQAIRGYINVLRYSTENYKTMDNEMTTVVENS